MLRSLLAHRWSLLHPQVAPLMLLPHRAELLCHHHMPPVPLPPLLLLPLLQLLLLCHLLLRLPAVATAAGLRGAGFSFLVLAPGRIYLRLTIVSSSVLLLFLALILLHLLRIYFHLLITSFLLPPLLLPFLLAFRRLGFPQAEALPERMKVQCRGLLFPHCMCLWSMTPSRFARC